MAIFTAPGANDNKNTWIIFFSSLKSHHGADLIFNEHIAIIVVTR